jgi:phospholipid/cholesterol/gamma-HCH transport system substrate-binding protein
MATPVERKAARTVGAGVVVLVTILVLFYLTFKSQTGLPFEPHTEVKASISDLHSLRTNDDIRENSKRIGRVKSIDFAPDGKALVTMELEGNVPVYRDAHAAIWDYSALATKFIELTPGTEQAGPIDDGVIPASQTESSKDISQVLDIFDPATRNAATSTVRELGGGFAGHSDDLQSFLSSAPKLLTNVGTVTSALADRQADLPDLLRSGASLTGSLANHDQQIDQLIGQVDTTFRAINTQNAGPLKSTLDRAPETLSTVRPALDRLDQPLGDTETAMRTLEPGAVALGKATPDLRGVLREGVPVAEKIPDVSSSAKPALGDLTDTASDARPLAPKAVETLDSLKLALDGIAPYGPEIGNFFVRSQSFVSEGPDPSSRFARVGVDVSPSAATAGIYKSGNGQFNPYPKPGEDRTLHSRSGPPGGLPGVPAIPTARGGK